jgi:hypothetical protein
MRVPSAASDNSRLAHASERSVRGAGKLMQLYRNRRLCTLRVPERDVPDPKNRHAKESNNNAREERQLRVPERDVPTRRTVTR